MNKPQPIEPKIGTHVLYLGDKWLVLDISRSVFTGLVTSADLRRTVVIDPMRRFLDRAILRRGVPVEHLGPLED